jgi:molybdopterin synthase catalytic subunit
VFTHPYRLIDPPSARAHTTLDCRGKWSVEKIAVAHRLGVTAVEEASVIIAISSVHRRESLLAVQYCIDALKATVPIW